MTVYNVALLSAVVLGVLLVDSNDPAVVTTIYVLGVTLAVVLSVVMCVGSKMCIIRYGGSLAVTVGANGEKLHQSHYDDNATQLHSKWTATSPARNAVLVSHTSNVTNANRSRVTVHPIPSSPLQVRPTQPAQEPQPLPGQISDGGEQTILSNV